MLSFDSLAIDMALGLVPLWPGFAINTLFDATIAWLLIRGPIAWRRLHRAKRGHCIACGYALRGQIDTVDADASTARCPECGAVVTCARA